MEDFARVVPGTIMAIAPTASKHINRISTVMISALGTVYGTPFVIFFSSIPVLVIIPYRLTKQSYAAALRMQYAGGKA